MKVTNGLLHTPGHGVNVAVAGGPAICEAAQASGAEPFLDGFGSLGRIAGLDAERGSAFNLPDFFASVLQESEDSDRYKKLRRQHDAADVRVGFAARVPVRCENQFR
jgi:hypothetical protein